MSHLILTLNIYNANVLESALQELGFVKENHCHDCLPHSWYYSMPHGFKLFRVFDYDFHYICDPKGNVVLCYREIWLDAFEEHKYGKIISGDYWIWLYKEPYYVISDSDLEPVPEDLRVHFILKTNSNFILRVWEQEQLDKFKQSMIDNNNNDQAWERPVGTVEHVVLK